MLHRASALRVCLLAALVTFPIVVLACGDDDAASPAPTTAADASTVPDVVTGPTMITVTIPGATYPDGGEAFSFESGYVVFYPKESPDKPVVEPIDFGQTVSKSMPEGAHVVIATRIGGQGAQGNIYQYDDVGPGETITFGLPSGAFSMIVSSLTRSSQ